MEIQSDRRSNILDSYCGNMGQKRADLRPFHKNNGSGKRTDWRHSYEGEPGETRGTG